MLKIAILGPESTGKSTLASQLAEHFGTDYVPEYAREYLKDFKGLYKIDDVIKIAIGQQQWIDNAEANNPKILIADTEMIVNKIWCEYVFHSVPQGINSLVENQDFDLYLLCDIDLEWTYDPLRENPDLGERKTIFAMYESELKRLKANYCIINGQDQQRLQNAIDAIKQQKIS